MNAPSAQLLCRWTSIGWLAIAGVGCATWTDRSEPDRAARVDLSSGGSGNGGGSGKGGMSNLFSQQNRSSAVRVTLEFLTMPTGRPEAEPISGDDDDEGPSSEGNSHADREASVWQWVDETVIAASTRRQLQSNGLRIGRVVQEDRFRRAIEQRHGGGGDEVDTLLREAEVLSSLAQGSRKLSMRFGRRYEIPLHQPRSGQQVLLLRENRELVGRTLSHPQLLLGLLLTQGNTPGEVVLGVRPEIQHGEAKQSFVKSDSALRIDTRREVWKLENLDFAATLTEGDAFVISTTTPPIGIGEQMLTDVTSGHGREQLVLLIRLTAVPSLADRLGD